MKFHCKYRKKFRLHTRYLLDAITRTGVEAVTKSKCFFFGSEADICAAKSDVRFTPNSDINCVFWACPLWAAARSGHSYRPPTGSKLRRRNAKRYCTFGPFGGSAQGYGNMTKSTADSVRV